MPQYTTYIVYKESSWRPAAPSTSMLPANHPTERLAPQALIAVLNPRASFWLPLWSKKAKAFGQWLARSWEWANFGTFHDSSWFFIFLYRSNKYVFYSIHLHTCSFVSDKRVLFLGRAAHDAMAELKSVHGGWTVERCSSRKSCKAISHCSAWSKTAKVVP